MNTTLPIYVKNPANFKLLTTTINENNTYADACLTRITDKHHTYRLEMNGINMRETD